MDWCEEIGWKKTKNERERERGGDYEVEEQQKTQRKREGKRELRRVTECLRRREAGKGKETRKVRERG